MATRISWLPYFVLIVALLLTAISTHYVAETITSKDRLRFDANVGTLHDHVQNRLSMYVAMLRAARGLFAASDTVSLGEFRTFVEELRVAEQYKGVQGLGFTMRIPPESLDEVTSAMLAQGITGFRVWPETPREEYHSIVFLEPLDRRNLAAIGYDMSTEETRWEAMERARDTGRPAMSGKVMLVQEIDEVKQAGFLIYLPVFRGGRTPEELAERRAGLLGFVYSPFRAGDLLEEVMAGRETHAIDYAVYDGASESEETLLHRSPGFDPSQQARYTSTAYVSVARRTWTLKFRAAESFDFQSDRQLIPLTASGGVLGSLLLFAVTFSQARARQQAERQSAELRVSRQEAETANRLKDQFLATVSHELRTPLNAITGWTHLLLEGSGLDAETRDGLEVIDRNAKLQADLVDELLDVSRIISGRLRLNLARVDLVKVVEDALETVRPAIEARGTHIEKNIEAQRAILVGDAGRLQQVVWNLLSNAIKFTPRGGRVDVALRQVESHLELKVADTGRGFSPEFRPYIFNAFRQADSSSTRQHGGLGLGLAIVHHLVELHGGTVTAESAGEDKGATFTVYLPVQAVAPDRAPAVPPSTVETERLNGRDEERALRDTRVLVVDDEPDARLVIRKALERCDATVHEAESAADALKSFGKERPTVIISDIGMPDIDGYELIRRIREIEAGRPPIPAIALTAYARPVDRDRASEAGFQAHLAKPVTPTILVALVRRFAEASPEPDGKIE